MPCGILYVSQIIQKYISCSNRLVQVCTGQDGYVYFHAAVPMMGSGCASVFNTHSSNGSTLSSENIRYRYLIVSARKKDCNKQYTICSRSGENMTISTATVQRRARHQINTLTFYLSRTSKKWAKEFFSSMQRPKKSGQLFLVQSKY